MASQKIKIELPNGPAISLVSIYACMLSHLSCAWLFATPMTIACEALLSIGLSWQEYWDGLPFPPPGDLSDPGIETVSPVDPALAEEFFITWATWEAPRYIYKSYNIEGIKSASWSDICTPVFIIALFAIAKVWKQPKFPFLEKCIKK